MRKLLIWTVSLIIASFSGFLFFIIVIGLLSQFFIKGWHEVGPEHAVGLFGGIGVIIIGYRFLISYFQKGGIDPWRRLIYIVLAFFFLLASLIVINSLF